MFEDITKRKQPVVEKLLEYGFESDGKCFEYSTSVLGGAFILKMTIKPNGEIDTALIEKENGEEYILYKTSASGEYVGNVRAEIERIIADIVQKCYEPSVFKTAQAKAVIKFVKDTYGDELEFLWQKFPDNAVWRRKDNNKWYGAILTVSGGKIGLCTEKIVEIIDLRMDSKKAAAILSQENHYPGWHMNKKSWYTLVLDGSISDEELKAKIAERYDLAGK
ncbi:MAG: MmcQ/YjbR family DNA-binding protein [Kiritimatiellia bacterium]